MDEEQLGFDLGSGATRAEPFPADEIRREAMAFLAEARAVTEPGRWDEGEVRYRRILFPHMVSWLPDPVEREQLCFAFLAELDRIELLLAA